MLPPHVANQHSPRAALRAAASFSSTFTLRFMIITRLDDGGSERVDNDAGATATAWESVGYRISARPALLRELTDEIVVAPYISQHPAPRTFT